VQRLIDDETDLTPQQRPGVAGEPPSIGLVEGYIEPTGLKDVHAGGVDQGDGGLGAIEAFRQKVGGE
jgi:hypothetical protein